MIASLVPFLIMLTRLAFEAYPLHLIYSEAFKIESLSCKTNQLVLLVRQLQRSSSQVYDSPSCTTTTKTQQRAPLEPNLFEPMRLSAGDYFSLTRRSMCAFLAAIVTFSVMFIGEFSCPSVSLLFGSVRKLRTNRSRCHRKPEIEPMKKELRRSKSMLSGSTVAIRATVATATTTRTT